MKPLEWFEHANADPVAATALAGLVVVVLVGGIVSLAAERWTRRDGGAHGGAGRSQLASQVRSISLAVTFLMALLPLLAGGVYGSWAVAVPFVAVVAWSVRHTAEDLFAGILLSLHPAFRKGNLIRIDDVTGHVTGTGLVRLRIRSVEQGEVSLPNREVWSRRLVHLSREGTDSPIHVRLPVPPTMEGHVAMTTAVVCAATSPYASLHQRPQTFLEFDEAEPSRAIVRVRAFVFDPVYAETYRSHIIEAWFERVRGGMPVEDAQKSPSYF